VVGHGTQHTSGMGEFWLLLGLQEPENGYPKLFCSFDPALMTEADSVLMLSV
jgi:hypothetical protein